MVTVESGRELVKGQTWVGEGKDGRGKDGREKAVRQGRELGRLGQAEGAG